MDDELDSITHHLMKLRTQRFAIVADSGKVEKVLVEEAPTQLSVTDAEEVLKQVSKS